MFRCIRHNHPKPRLCKRNGKIAVDQLRRGKTMIKDNARQRRIRGALRVRMENLPARKVTHF